jgi:type IV pilus biogenesis protein CpaD/CtpE
MKSRSIALALGLLFMTSGCALNSPVNEQWGRSYSSTRAAQVADPNAPASDAAVENMDAKSGEAVADRYYKGQRNQQTRQAPQISISGN